MSRREARIARQHQKELKDADKKARLIEAVAATEEPRITVEPSQNKSPRVVASPASIMQMKMSFNIFDFADREGEWSWGQGRNWCSSRNVDGSTCIIRLTMNEMSQLSWAEILAQMTGGKDRHRKHHSQKWDSLCGEAQDRWLEIDRTEEELFRFRVGGTQRIWGVRQGATFYVVWWDEEHQIYPTEKD